MRRAAKKDRNHNAICDHLTALGYRCLDLSRVGDGCPDVLVIGVERRSGLRRAWLIEIKMPGEALTPAEQSFHGLWGDDVSIVDSIAAAEQLVGIRS